MGEPPPNTVAFSGRLLHMRLNAVQVHLNLFVVAVTIASTRRVRVAHAERRRYGNRFYIWNILMHTYVSTYAHEYIPYIYVYIDKIGFYGIT